MINYLKAQTRKLTTQTPYIWNLAWKIINHFSFLLPHDNSYWGLQHFCISKPGLFLDVGANTGISALSFRKMNKTTPIISIEPNPLHQASLARLTQKIPFFSFLLIGAGDEPTETTLYTPVYKNIILHTFTSASQEQVHTAIQESFGIKVSKKVYIQKLNVKIVPIDQLKMNPSIIKIDAEGFDYQVLLGAKKTIERTRPFFMIEMCWSSYNKITTFFSAKQYDLFYYDSQKHYFYRMKRERTDNKMENKNVFAIPQEKLNLVPIKPI